MKLCPTDMNKTSLVFSTHTVYKSTSVDHSFFPLSFANTNSLNPHFLRTTELISLAIIFNMYHALRSILSKKNYFTELPIRTNISFQCLWGSVVTNAFEKILFECRIMTYRSLPRLESFHQNQRYKNRGRKFFRSHFPPLCKMRNSWAVVAQLAVRFWRSRG